MTAPAHPELREAIALNVWNDRFGRLPDASFEGAKAIARKIPDGRAADAVNKVYASADALIAGPLATLIADRDKAVAERDEARARHRIRLLGELACEDALAEAIEERDAATARARRMQPRSDGCGTRTRNFERNLTPASKLVPGARWATRELASTSRLVPPSSHRRPEMATPAPDPAILDDLIARLEAATGADRELDLALAIALWTDSDRAPFDFTIKQARGMKPPAPAFTRSVDAALTAVKHSLPNSWVTASDGRVWMFSTPSFDLTAGVQGSAPTPPLAICLALLRALRHEATSHA